MLSNSNFWGMNLIWWFAWMVMLFWKFATTYDIPGQRRKKDSPLDILHKSFATGVFTKAEYAEQKKYWKPIQRRKPKEFY